MKKERVKQLFYMDELKLFGRVNNQLKRIFNSFSNDIVMDFRRDKWVRVTFKKGSITETNSIDLQFVSISRKLKQEASKHIGVSDGERIEHTQMKENKKKNTTGCASDVKYCIKFT